MRATRRKSRPMFLSIDFDAHSLLIAMLPHSRGRGSFISELIRREARERSQRAHLVGTLQAMVPAAADDVLAAVGAAGE